MMKAVCLGGRPSDGKALEEARWAYVYKRPGRYFSGPFTALGCEEGWMLSVGCCALWLLPKQPTIAHIRANAARPFASCLLSTPAGFPRHRHRRWQPHPEKGMGLYLPSQRIAPGRRKAFLPRFAVGFSAQGGSTWFFAELAGALAALAGRKGFAWMRAVRLIGEGRR